MTCKVFSGNCIEVMQKMIDEGVVFDAIVTDPPYGLEFMGFDFDGADGFRRSLNEADANRDSVFGRTSKKAPEYRTVGTGQKSKPGIGERETEWVSNQGWNKYRCSLCGHLFHGGSPCQCENPQPIAADNRWNLFQEFCEEWASLCLKLLKPGGHLVAFGGGRTYHRLACAIEDAGFEIREQLAYCFGSGFPKSMNVAKAIDKAMRGVPQGGSDPTSSNHGKFKAGSGMGAGPGQFMKELGETVERELVPEAQPWKGWGTSVKPAWEPIVLARKPLIGTVAANVLKFGTGGINIDACRVAFVDEADEAESKTKNQHGDFESGPMTNQIYGKFTQDRANYNPAGRFPANLILDGSDEVLEEFAKYGNRGGGDKRGQGHGKRSGGFGNVGHENGDPEPNGRLYSDTGTPARFFYSAKASKRDRCGSKHPTVKPVALLRWLVRLVTPPGGTILDPFAGTGTTGEAAIREGFNSCLIEREPEYLADIERRLATLDEETESPLDNALFYLPKSRNLNRGGS